MKKLHLAIIAFALGITVLGASSSVEKAHKEVREVMADAIAESDLPSVVAIAINSKGHRIEYAYGGVNWGKSDPVKTSSIFRIHSMTKIVTSIAAMQLVEQGKVELDQDLSEFLPEMAKIPIMKENGEFVEPKSAITLRHLLTHTAGFGYPNRTYKLSENFDASEWKYKDLPRQFESGSQFLYGTNTDWAGKLVEKVSGMTLDRYFKKKIFKPLGIKSTYFNVPKKEQKRIVSMGNRGVDGKGDLKEIDGDEVSPSRYPKEKVKNFSGGGGLFSTPSDFTKILQCMLDHGACKGGRILKKETIELMMQNHIGDISLNPEGWHYDPGSCCNFNGIMDKDSKWGLATLIDNTPESYGRKKGALVWGGYRNTYFYIDYKSGIAASIYSQHLPFNHPETISLFEKFSEVFYKNFKK